MTFTRRHQQKEDVHVDGHTHMPTQTYRHTDSQIHRCTHDPCMCMCICSVIFMVYKKIAILRFFTFFDILLSCCLVFVQTSGWTPMHTACWWGSRDGSLDCVKALHSAGADTSIEDRVSS